MSYLMPTRSVAGVGRRWKLSRSHDVRKTESRPSEVFQSTGSVHGLVEPKVEAAGIEPASEAAPDRASTSLGSR